MGECIVATIWEENIMKAQGTSDAIKCFQPHLGVKQIKYIKKKLEDDREFPIYFVPGRFGNEATFKGKIIKIVADKRDISQDMRECFNRQGDNINHNKKRSAIAVKFLEELAQPVKVSKFVKVSDKTPLRVGFRTACICYEP